METVWLELNVVLDHCEARELTDEIRNNITVARQALEDKSDSGSAVVCRMHFRNSDPTAAFATKHSLVFHNCFGHIGLSNRCAHNAGAIACRNLIYGATGRDISHDESDPSLQSCLCGKSQT